MEVPSWRDEETANASQIPADDSWENLICDMVFGICGYEIHIRSSY